MAKPRQIMGELNINIFIVLNNLTIMYKRKEITTKGCYYHIHLLSFIAK